MQNLFLFSTELGVRVPNPTKLVLLHLLGLRQNLQKEKQQVPVIYEHTREN